MFFVTFVRMLPRRIAAAISAIAAVLRDSRELQTKMERKLGRRLDG